uniref:Type II toxin-antitoxin system RelE/ParE family toxin n=1 Tax=Syphacia muris TaxID=451379 RepID=A0A0N5A9E4_9BILA
MLDSVVGDKRGAKRNGCVKMRKKTSVATKFVFNLLRNIEELNALESAISLCTNEKFLEVYVSKEKGRGIRSLKDFRRNDFVVEYK